MNDVSGNNWVDTWLVHNRLPPIAPMPIKHKTRLTSAPMHPIIENMSTSQTTDYLQLDGFIIHPREDIDVEYKDWLNLRVANDKATLAKAAIALTNHGGGHIILGFREGGQALQSVARPSDVPEITQDDVNAAIRRYAEPEFHCQVYDITHPDSGVSHSVVRVPGSDVPVQCKRDQQGAGLSQHRYYVRKPGPRSEDPRTAEEWRRLIDRCILARREDMLDSIRSILLGIGSTQDAAPEPLEALEEYCRRAYERWEEVVSHQPANSPSRFPHGFYEMAFALVDATPAENLNELLDRLKVAQSVKLSGWTPFLHMSVEGWEPYPREDAIEAWIGRPVESRVWNDPSHADFWRASLDGKLYTIRGYIEDAELSLDRARAPGTEFSNALPTIKIAEALLFTSRLAATFESAEQVAIRCRFTRMEGRSLLLMEQLPFIDGGPVSRDPEVTLTKQVSLQQINDNLVEVIHDLVIPLYERFGFYQVSIGHVQRMLQHLRRFS